MKIFLLLMLTLLLSYYAKAQSLAINTDGSTANISALLDVKSTTKGMLIPRMDSAQRASIPTPANGLLVYQTNKDSGFYHFDGTTWQQLINTKNNLWKRNGNHIYNNNTGNVGIGIINPLAKLHVADSSVVFSAAGDVPGTPLDVPITGEGRRLMWYADKAALRAGYAAFSEWDSVNIGNYSVAFGKSAMASGDFSLAMGGFPRAIGDYSTAMGSSTSLGFYSTALGFSVAAGDYATATGGSNAIGFRSTALGRSSTGAVAEYATAMGESSASANYSTAMGKSSATGIYSTAMGFNSTSIGSYSFAVGNGSSAAGDNAVAMGASTANAHYSVAMGVSTTLGASYAIAMGASQAIGFHSVAMGTSSAIGSYAIAMGQNAQAGATNAVAIGLNADAAGTNAVAIGINADAAGGSAIAIGNSTANNQTAVAIGSSTANGFNSVAMGNSTTTINGQYATAMGYSTANADFSSSMGNNTIAQSSNSLVIGKYNDITAANRLFEIGNGNGINERSNALTVLANGNTGIGVSNPGEKLEVNGKIKTTELQMTNNASIGRVLTSDATGNANWADPNYYWTLNANDLHNNNTGNTGIAVTDPAFKLDVGGRMRIRSIAGNTAGTWLNNDANTSSPAFIGMRNDSLVGFYGTAAPNSGWGMLMNTNSGRVGIGTDNPAAALHVIGNIIASGTITPSDVRYKTNIRPINQPLQKLLSLNGVSYLMNSTAFPQMHFDNDIQYGLIAQEVEKVFPEMVKQITADGYKGIDYVKLVPVLIEGLKALYEKIDQQQKQIELLKKEK